MEKSFWINAWRDGQTGFHQGAVHADLLSFGDQWLGEQPRIVLVPLCGQSVDLLWLRDRGHEVYGVELAQQAVEGFFKQHNLAASRTTLGASTAWQAEGMTVLEGDIFQLDPDLLPKFDRVWDRAALVALAPEQREPYAAMLNRLCASGAQMLLNTFAYDQSMHAGPPHSVPESLVRNLFSDHQIELLREEEAISRMRGRAEGLTSWLVQTLRVTLR